MQTELTTDAREQRLRRAATREGLRFIKSRRAAAPAYMLVDAEYNVLVASWESLEDAEAAFS